MSDLFGSEVIHHTNCLENASFYSVYVADQITQIGRAAFAVLRKARVDLNNAIRRMVDNMVATCVLMRCSITTLVEHRITSYESFFQEGMAGPAEHRLFYLCLQHHTQSQLINNVNLEDAEDRSVDTFAARCLENTSFSVMKQEFQRMHFALMGRLQLLHHSRRWIMTPEGLLMGLQCRLSNMHDALMTLDKTRPVSGQINMSQTFTAVADIAVYLMHFQEFLSRDNPGWTDEGIAYVRPVDARPRPVPSTRPGNE
jgi:hypothetical protein